VLLILVTDGGVDGSSCKRILAGGAVCFPKARGATCYFHCYWRLATGHNKLTSFNSSRLKKESENCCAFLVGSFKNSKANLNIKEEVKKYKSPKSHDPTKGLFNYTASRLF
jgi:hypothetical protein